MSGRTSCLREWAQVRGNGRLEMKEATPGRWISQEYRMEDQQDIQPRTKRALEATGAHLAKLMSEVQRLRDQVHRAEARLGPRRHRPNVDQQPQARM